MYNYRVNISLLTITFSPGYVVYTCASLAVQLAFYCVSDYSWNWWSTCISFCPFRWCWVFHDGFFQILHFKIAL